MDKFKELNKNEILQDKPHCVFVSIVCRNAEPFKKNKEEKKYRNKDKKVTLCLMQMRWDGSLGFPGGKIDNNEIENNIVTEEILINGLIREMEEEIGLNRNKINPNNFKKLCTFTDDKFYIHNYIYDVDFEEFEYIFKNSINSQNIISENCGSVVLHLTDYSSDKGIPNLLQHRYSATAKLELLKLLNFLGLR